MSHANGAGCLVHGILCWHMLGYSIGAVEVLGDFDLTAGPHV